MANDNMAYALAARELTLPSGRPNYIRIVNEGLPIHHMRKSYGELCVVTVLTMMLQKFASSFNVSKNMNTTQINDYAISLMLEHVELGDGTPSMRLEDLAMFFERAKTGAYGRPFDYLDAPLIEEWLEKYWAERMAEVRMAQSEYVREQKFDSERPERDKHGKLIQYIDPAVSAKALEDAFTAMGLVKATTGKWVEPKSKQLEESREASYQSQKALLQEYQKAEAHKNSIRVLCDMIEFGDPLSNSANNRQFYDNHKIEIESELQRRAAMSPLERHTAFAVDVATGLIQLGNNPAAARYYRTNQKAIDRQINLLNGPKPR